MGSAAEQGEDLHIREAPKGQSSWGAAMEREGEDEESEEVNLLTSTVITSILQMGKLSSGRLGNLPEATPLVTRGTWSDTHSF